MATWDQGPGSIGSMNTRYDDIYYDPRTGKYLGHMKDAKWNKRGKGWTNFEEVAVLTAGELAAFEKYNKPGVNPHGKKGRDAYTGPGRLLGQAPNGFDDPSFDMSDEPEFKKRGGYKTGPFGGGGKERGHEVRADSTADDEYIDEIINRATWWDMERVGGQRGDRRKSMLSSRNNAVQAFRDAFYGNDWGGK